MQEFLNRIAPFWRPHSGQRDFLLSPARTRVLACGRRWGKTDACAADVAASLESESPRRWFLVAPTLVQARILFRRVLDFVAFLTGSNPKPQWSPYPTLEIGSHRISTRSGHRRDSIRGEEATDIVVDEAAYTDPALIDEVLTPMMATTNGRLALISTPNGMNHFWQAFNEGDDPQSDVWARRAPSEENPYVSPEFLARQRRLIAPRVYAAEYEAAFADAAGVVIPNHLLEAATDPALSFPDNAPVAVGVDWAQTHDHTALAILRGDTSGAALQYIGVIPRNDSDRQISTILQALDHLPPGVIASDATGLGSDPSRRLADAAPRWAVLSVTFNQRTKADLIEGLAAFFDRRRIRIPADSALVKELRTFVGVVGPAGRLAYGATAGRHDDLVIALALAIHALRSPTSLIRSIPKP